MISIIIPTYNEAKNIRLLIPKIVDVLGTTNRYEIIVIDDNSPDKTGQIVKKMKTKYPVRIITRKRQRGLSSAVIAGFRVAKGSVIGVMDADLSHPPELILSLIEEIKKGADISIGSRLIGGGGSESWPLSRKLISFIAQLLARPLTPVKDTMSGFFFFKKQVIKNAPLVPRGYKILLEILVKGNFQKVKEVPFVFLNRTFGKSEINIGVEMEYIKQLINLYRYKYKK